MKGKTRRRENNAHRGSVHFHWRIPEVQKHRGKSGEETKQIVKCECTPSPCLRSEQCINGKEEEVAPDF